MAPSCRRLFLADIPLNRRLQQGVPDDLPGLQDDAAPGTSSSDERVPNEVLQVADNFSLLFHRPLGHLFWPCARNLRPPHFAIDATGAIKFKGAVRLDRAPFFRWPVIGGTDGAQGFQAALDEVKDALRRQLAKWQSEGTGAVRCHSKASS